jgi:7-cyano-7-deazaguanine synthase in queuosine biosynthesis
VVITGSKSLGKVTTDPFSFRDSTLGFYALMQAAVRGAMEQGSLRIEPILAEGRDRKMEKVEVYRQLLEHRIDPNVTWSCYHPSSPGGEACGVCRNCLEKRNCMLLLKNRISALHGQD